MRKLVTEVVAAVGWLLHGASVSMRIGEEESTLEFSNLGPRKAKVRLTIKQEPDCRTTYIVSRDPEGATPWLVQCAQRGVVVEDPMLVGLLIWGFAQDMAESARAQAFGAFLATFWEPCDREPIAAIAATGRDLAPEELGHPE